MRDALGRASAASTRDELTVPETFHLVDPAAREAVAGPVPFDPARDTVEQFRRAVQASYPDDPIPCEERTIPGPPGATDVRVLLHRPQQARSPAPAILYLHGGGYVAGTPDMMASLCDTLATESGALVVAVQYRLAPETPFPGPLEDCHAALTWLAAEAGALGIDRDRIAVMGQSAGGGLAAALALLARDRGGPALKAQFLIYPMLDPRTGTADAPVDNSTTGELVWTRAANRFGWSALRGGQDITPARLGHFAPALADTVAGLPPTFVAVGALDLFLEEDVAYALRLSRAGIPIDLHLYPGGVHGFDAFPGALADRFHADLYAAIQRFL